MTVQPRPSKVADHSVVRWERRTRSLWLNRVWIVCLLCGKRLGPYRDRHHMHVNAEGAIDRHCERRHAA